MVATELSCNRIHFNSFKTYFQRSATVLCWNRPSVSSFGFAKSVVLKKKSHQENCEQLHYFLANVSLKRCSIFVTGLIEIWPLWRSIASSKPRFLSHISMILWPDLLLGERLLLPVVLLKSHPVLSPRGCGCLPKCRSAWIRAVGLNWSHKVEEKNPILPSCHSGLARVGASCLLALWLSETSEVAQAPWGARKLLCSIPRRLLGLPLPLSGLCPLCRRAGVGGFVLPCSTEMFSSWSHSAAFLEGRRSPLPSPRAQQQRKQSFCFCQQLSMELFCRIPV